MPKCQTIKKGTALAVAILCLTSCGGGGSSSRPPVQATPAPAPAPTPTPSPSPSPTPTPTAAPFVAIDYSAPFALQTELAYTFEWFTPTGGNTILNASTPALLGTTQTTELVFQPQAIEEMRFRFGDSFVVFGASNLLATTGFRAYRREPEQLTIERIFNYVVRSSWRTRSESVVRNGQTGAREVYRVGIIGRKSVVSDPFNSPSLNYNGNSTARGGAIDSDTIFGTRSSFSYTPSNNTVFGSILAFQNVNNTETQQAALRLDGSFDQSNNRLSGTISDSSFGWTGTWQGFFFGPDRIEVGLTFRATNAKGDVLVGDFIGMR